MGDGPPPEYPPQPTSLPELPKDDEQTRPNSLHQDFDAFQSIDMSEDDTLPDRNAASHKKVDVISDTPANRGALAEARAGEPTISVKTVDEGKLAQALQQPPTVIGIKEDRHETQPVQAGTTLVFASPGSGLGPVPATHPDALAHQVDRAIADHPDSGGTTVMRIIRGVIDRAAHRRTNPIDSRRIK